MNDLKRTGISDAYKNDTRITLVEQPPFVGLNVIGSAKTCQDARIFENHFLAFYNSVMQGDYNALFHVCSLFRCETTSAAVPLLRGRKIGIIASEIKLPALQLKFRILNFKSALRHYINSDL